MLFRVSVFSGLPVNATGDRRGLAPDRLVAAYVLLIVVAGLGRLWWATEAWLLLVGLATAAALVAVATRRIPFKDPLTCLLLAASALVFTAADAIFSAQKLPPVHPVDVVFVPAYALAVVALYRLNRLADREAGYLDTAVLAAGLTVLLVAALDKGAPSAGADSLVLLYPLAGLVVLTLSVRLMMCYRTPASWLMLAAAVWLLAGGFVPALFGYPVSALLLETLHMGTMACWGLAALWRPMPALPGAVDAVDRRPPVWLFALVVLLPPVALLIRAGMDLDTREAVLAVACAVAGLFVVTRLGAAASGGDTDPVTGLIVIPVLLTDARARLGTGKAPTLFLIDLEQFHVVNQSAGRRGGDRVLRQIGQELSQAAGDGRVARGSLYRFAVLAELHAADGADQLADAVTAAVARPVYVEGHRLHLRCSIGYATAASPDVDDLLVNAEAALHAAKNAGPGTRIGYHQELREADLQEAALTADLREAIDTGQLLLEYQPIVALADGLIEGFEALVRWQHPRLGRLGPDRFVQLAESVGLIGDLGAWVLSQGVAGAATLNAAAGRPVFVDINVSAAQFGPRLARDLHRALADGTVNPHMIVLELTETMLIPDRHWLACQLEALKTTGVRVAVDDFGTGHSSLALLRDLPIDIIKIDRMFVDGLTPGGPAQMIAGILQIADALGAGVVAEGIERTSERDLLTKLGCRLGQGYLYSRPVGLDQARALIQAGSVIR